MIRSMTGFGAGHARVGDEEILSEVRAVNGKFCEVKLRLPRELAPLEAEAQRIVKERLARGSIEVSIKRGGLGVGALEPRVDDALARRYAERFETLRRELGLRGEVSLADVLGAEGVVGLAERAPDLAAAEQALRRSLDLALEGCLQMRTREGAALARDLETRLEAIAAHAERLESQVPVARAHARERLHRRVQELAGDVTLDPARMAQELAILVDRTDVTEELTRLRVHLDQLRALLRQPEPAGRRMDFLVQELNREINTAGSKSQWAEATSIVVDLKAELERVREQVQNVE